VRELCEDILRKSTTVDWSVRESVKAKLRLLVKRILKKYKYPPDQQAEVLSESGLLESCRTPTALPNRPIQYEPCHS
jgi:hypothetical protein